MKPTERTIKLRQLRRERLLRKELDFNASAWDALDTIKSIVGIKEDSTAVDHAITVTARQLAQTKQVEDFWKENE